MSDLAKARYALMQAALRVLSADYADMHPHTGADAELADDLLALAARDLFRATQALPYDQQPVGWDKETSR